jgi:hypothetical protein
MIHEHVVYDVDVAKARAYATSVGLGCDQMGGAVRFWAYVDNITRSQFNDLVDYFKENNQ